MIERKRIVSHPGVYVKDAIDELGLSQSEFALRTGLSIKNVSTLINGESNITFDVAVKLADFFHNDIEGWINLQIKYNLFLNQEKRQKEYADDWQIVKQFDKGFVTDFLNIQIDSKNREKTVDELRRVFNVASLQNLKNPDMYAFCRTSVIKDINEKTIIMRNAWISLAEQIAREMPCEPFDKERIISNTKYLRSLTRKGADGINHLLSDFLYSCGVKLVVLPFLSGSNLSGVTKWNNNGGCVMVAINDCGKDADKIWFSLFHELGHAIQNHKRHMTISYSKNSIQDEEENEANLFARNSLIDEDVYEEFLDRNDFSLRAIEKLSRDQGVADYIIIGRLQKDEKIGWNQYQNLKRKFEINYRKDSTTIS